MTTKVFKQREDIINYTNTYSLIVQTDSFKNNYYKCRPDTIGIYKKKKKKIFFFFFLILSIYIYCCYFAFKEICYNQNI